MSTSATVAKNTAGVDPAFRGNALRPHPSLGSTYSEPCPGWDGARGPFSGTRSRYRRKLHLMRLYTRTSAHRQIIPAGLQEHVAVGELGPVKPRLSGQVVGGPGGELAQRGEQPQPGRGQRVADRDGRPLVD